MAKLVGSVPPGNFGENRFLSRARAYLDDRHIIYWNRQLFGREFDVCILMPGKGILVVELKGWRESSILRVEHSDTILIRTPEGEVPSNPQKQARGYRFSLERKIRQATGKFPLVVPMVCLPQVSRAYYKSRRLDVVLEEPFTILKEDLDDVAFFYKKLDQALVPAGQWKRDPFDDKTMLAVRRLFETEAEEEDSGVSSAEPPAGIPCHDHDYSRFYFFDTDASLTDALEEMIRQYRSGCKLYGVCATPAQLVRAAAAIDAALSLQGVVRNRDRLRLDLDRSARHSPEVKEGAVSFTAFHCAFSVWNGAGCEAPPALCIRNGQLRPGEEALLKALSAHSAFNAEQYLVEHADPEKHIVIRAGAGTGKTHTMIARIGYICYTQNTSLQKMAERVVMITFTNEAADQMAEKLKAYFQNCYLLTARPEYLAMAARVGHMQISTIHSYAKKLIARLGTEFGYGVDVSITSSEFDRRRKISDRLDGYISAMKKRNGPGYPERLGMPVYAIRESILDFIRKLHNKSVDVAAITAQNFGSILPDDPRHELHALLAEIIPAVEREYAEELLNNNQIHLGSMMALLNRFLQEPKNAPRIQELKKEKQARQFMFVDEFQDTDDTQIESLLTLAGALDYRLFLVGDIKQCIYRFRGAKEKAFDQLHMERCPGEWLEYSLRRNYRTDRLLLDRFHRSFAAWGGKDLELLAYHSAQDRLLGTRDYNGYLGDKPDKFFKRLPIPDEAQRIPTLVEEIRRLQRRISYDLQQGRALSAEERSIAILVRENWQAETVRRECARLGIQVQTNTGGDLYLSQPALDMLTLVNALVHFDEADYLYNLAVSNFFRLDIPRSNLYEIRRKIREESWRKRREEREQANYLIRVMNLMLSNTGRRENTWEYLVRSLRTKPALQAIREVYQTLEPWKNYSEEPEEQRYYQLNVDLLFEELVRACNIDRLTVNTLREYLYNCIVSQVSVDSRPVPSDRDEAAIQCLTVHKAKGLEYGHVILPYGSASITHIKQSQLQVSTAKKNGQLQIGYSLNPGDSGAPIQNEYYDPSAEQAEKSREETRILYVAMTRAIRSFSWIELEGRSALSWQALIEMEAQEDAL